MTHPLIVTTALTYANGSLHLGHLLEQIQADIFVRAQRLSGQPCLFLSGSDAHGTPIMIKAQQQNLAPEQLVEKYREEHQRELAAFNIRYDHYSTTHSQVNQQLTVRIYEAAKAQGHIRRQSVELAYDPVAEIFLPDRLIKGTCPKCEAPNQYGDSCEQCGTTYSPTDLVNPVSTLSGATPIRKSSEHAFFCLEHHQAFLADWLKENHLSEAVANKLKEWFREALRSWDISRDAPYFGFPIPDVPNQYFYVWLDAPIGYLAALQELCDQRLDLSFEQLIHQEDSPLIHFIGKDIIYFHALFWPALLHSAGLRLPSHLYVHGFLTIHGEKMSKSRGTFITAQHFREHLPTDYLRYYFAAKLGSSTEDIDLDWQDFMNRINADLVGKLVNIPSRLAGFLHKYFQGKLAGHLPNEPLWNHLVEKRETLYSLFTEREYHHAIRLIMELADQVNQWIAIKQPWQMIKDPTQHEAVHLVCSLGINYFRLLIHYLRPVIPNIAASALLFLNDDNTTSWEQLSTPLLNHAIQPFSPLAERVTVEQVHAALSQ